MIFFFYPQSLHEVLTQDCFKFAINRDFCAVYEGCVNREMNWITDELKGIY
jgi:leucyl/phenylalanyl-tRNA--protein transferase